MDLGAADRKFVAGMITHHEDALKMANAYLDGAQDGNPRVVALAKRIVKAQTAEIKAMQSWLGGTSAKGMGM